MANIHNQNCVDRMALFTLNNTLWFPPLSEADSDGLLAIGGDLSIDRLLLAYKQGIFPWFDGTVPLWWSPDPRFVLFPQNIKVSKSMEQVIKKGKYRFSTNTAFSQVIASCKDQKRDDQNGTWITPEMEQSYNSLHQLGFAFSAETWQANQLVGGLYGIKMGKVFFGESMFAKATNASKFAFIHFVKLLESEGVEMIDCQVYTAHLESLGAQMISRNDFMNTLTSLI